MNLIFFRASWIGDYPDGENYLSLFYGENGAPPNYTFYNNPTYDSLYQVAVAAVNPEEYIPIYQEMERIIIDDAPVLFLYYDEVVRFVSKRISGLPPNAMNLLDLKTVDIFKLISMDGISKRSNRLFIILGGFFICNALIAEFIGVKLFSLEATLGLKDFNWRILGKEGTLVFHRWSPLMADCIRDDGCSK